MTIESYISEIDSARFGFSIAKVDDYTDGVESILRKLKVIGVKLVISRIDSGNIALINKLEDIGFRIKDTQLTFSYNFNDDKSEFSQEDSGNICIVNCRPEDASIVGEIAFKSFQGYGHYASDANLDIEKCNEIYRDWAIRSCLDRGVADYLFVAKRNDQVVGFLSLKQIKEDNETFGIQHFGAVDEKHRNFNIFRMLITQCLSMGRELGHTKQQTYLLSTNVPVMSSYLKLGFKIVKSHHTLHCWL